MDVKQAVTLAKQHVAELFLQEGIANLGLEEVEYDDSHDVWRVTVGFSRAWDQMGAIGVAAGLRRNRTYKIVSIADKDGTILSVKHREIA